MFGLSGGLGFVAALPIGIVVLDFASSTSWSRIELHAGLLETSGLMALRPDLVPSTVVEAPSVSVPDVPAIAAIAARPDWPGYFGAPRYATADLGRRSLEAIHDWLVPMALRILDGAADERTIARMTPQRRIRSS